MEYQRLVEENERGWAELEAEALLKEQEDQDAIEAAAAAAAVAAELQLEPNRCIHADALGGLKYLQTRPFYTPLMTLDLIRTNCLNVLNCITVHHFYQAAASHSTSLRSAEMGGHTNQRCPPHGWQRAPNLRAA